MTLGPRVKVQIRASGANPTDTYTRSGVRAARHAVSAHRPHQDGAGVIVAVGDGVPKQRIGERVRLFMAQWQRALGPRPHSACCRQGARRSCRHICGFNEGACLGVPWLTAHYVRLV